MLQNRTFIGVGILVLLIIANIIRYWIAGWGLITVTVTNVPLGQVIKSIERQGWVTIYTDMDLTTPVSMYVVKVPLAEAMESLTANAGGQWKLGFFAAPTSGGVKEEIRGFQSGSLDDDTKIYSYPTPLQMLAPSDPDADQPAADPRRQVWPGYHAPPPPPADMANNGTNAAPADATPPSPPTTLQDYLQAAAEEADIFIMAPGSWSPNVPAPPANSSISRAVQNLVASAHGTVEQAIILRARARREGGGPRGAGFVGDDNGWNYMEDRMNNAINGLPPEAQPEAKEQLAEEVKFQHQLAKAPPDQRRNLLRQHFMNRIGRDNWRRSPEKRAQMYQRAVANRQAARGQ